MKKSFYSIGSILILLLAAVIFVLIPALSDVADFRYPDYGSYNGIPVRYEEKSDFYEEANALVEQYERQGVDLNNEYAATYYAQIFNQAFQNTIGGIALQYFTDSTGYKVPEAAVNRTVRNRNEFRDASGNFSSAIYQSLSETEKRRVISETAKTLARMRSYEDIFGSIAEIGSDKIYGLKSSSAENDFIRKMGEKQYAFEAAAFDMKNYPDSEKVAFGNAHKDLFVKYNVKIISLDSESKAKEVLKRINNSEITFEDAITEYSTKYYGDPETGVLSANYKYQLSTAVKNADDADKIINLAKDSVSPIIETMSGYCIFKATDVPTQPDFTDDSTVVAVYSYLLTREKSVIEDYYAGIAKDFAAAAANGNFVATAETFNAKSSVIPAMALNYNNSTLVGKTTIEQDSVLRFAASNDNFYKTAFKLKKGEVSSPVVLSGANQVVVLKCTDIVNNGTPADEAKDLLSTEIAQASMASINYSILSSDKIKDNSAEFLKVFNGDRR